MELRIAQLLNTISPKKLKENVEKVDVHYCVLGKNSDKQQTRNKLPLLSGYTSLHLAAKRRALDLTKVLLEKGADPLRKDRENRHTPMHLVINTFFKRKVFYYSLISEGDLYTYYKNKELQEFSLMNILLSKQIEIKNTLNPKNDYGMSHLHIACIVNHAEAVEFFAKAGESLDQSLVCNLHDTDDDHDYEARHMKQLQGYSPLHCAIKYSSFKAADILLQYGADIHIKNAKGLSCVHLLIERIMDMTNFMTMGRRKLCQPYVEEIDRIESIIKLLLKARASNEIFVDDTGFSALHLACTLTDQSVVEDFLKQNIDVNMAVKNESKFWPGWTPLHFAACFNIQTMILLMRNGADIVRENSKGETALDLCAQRFSPGEIQLILSTKNQFQDIVLSDNCTKLLDLLLIMNDCDKFSDFLQKLKDVNIIVPYNSPIWAGYNLVHLSVSLNEKSILHPDTFWFDLPEISNPTLQRYNCTEEEEAFYLKRIEQCLEEGCSVDVKNAKGQSPIHLAFHMLREKAVVEKLLTCSEENIADQNDILHLHIACAQGDLDAVKKYLSEGADVNSLARISFDWHGEGWLFSENERVNVQENSTPLHVAVAFGHKHLVKYLLQKKADVYAKDSMDFTPIHLAMFLRHNSIAQLLFKRTPDLRDVVSKCGFSHLHVAACADDPEAVKKLLLRGAEIERVVDANVKRPPYLAKYAGKTPLRAATYFSENTLEALLQVGANVHAKDLQGISTLHYAIHDVDSSWTEPLVRSLKSGKCDVEGSGITLLHFACGSYDIEWAQELLANGADVNAKMDDVERTLQGATPLHMLFEPSYIYDFGPGPVAIFVRLLLDNGADAMIECRGRTPLHHMYEEMILDKFSLEEDSEFDETPLLQVADLLLENQKSYNDNPVDSQGFSHFHFACVRNNVDVVRKFLDSGVDVNESTDPFASDIGGFTPLHFALAHRSREVAYLLLKRGADVNAEDAHGNTPLHVGFKRRFVDLPLIKAMISRGADIQAKNLKEETLFHCLLRNGPLTFEALDFFLDSGCFINTLDIHQGIIGLAMRSAAPSGSQLILERFMQFREVESAIQNGFDVIQSIVSIKQKGQLTVDNYLSAIEFLMGIGFELDQEDTDGKTALHKAVSCYNLEAVNALLQLGADVNLMDHSNKAPISDVVIMNIKSYEFRKIRTVKVLARHIWKTMFTGLSICESNSRCLETVEEQMSFDDILEITCDELTKAQKTYIDQTLTMKDFLSNSGIIANYLKRCPDRRIIIDNIFKNSAHLREKFPLYCGILALQYRKALTRMELQQPAKESIILICQFPIPDLCLDAILTFLTNNEMKLVIGLAKELFSNSQ